MLVKVNAGVTFLIIMFQYFGMVCFVKSNAVFIQINGCRGKHNMSPDPSSGET